MGWRDYIAGDDFSYTSFCRVIYMRSADFDTQDHHVFIALHGRLQIGLVTLGCYPYCYCLLSTYALSILFHHKIYPSPVSEDRIFIEVLIDKYGI